MDSLDQKTLIVGCGIAGLTAALIFKKFGIHADIIEKSATSIPPEMGILLNQHTIDLLNELGMFKSLKGSGNSIQKGIITTLKGRNIAVVDLSKVRQNYGKTFGLLKSDLHGAFLKNLDHLHIRLNTKITSIENRESSTKVVFSDGTSKEYSLVIGADGIDSQVRPAIFPDSAPVDTGHRAYRFLVKGVKIKFDGIVEAWGRGRKIGMVPLGGDQFYCYALFNKSLEFDVRNYKPVAQVRALYKEFGGIVPSLLEALDENSPLIYSRIRNIRLKSWYSHRVILVGDAAHAISPNLGQGAAMAVEGVAKLCQQLNFSHNIEQGLRQYEEHQMPRVSSIQKYAHRAGQISLMQGLPASFRDRIIKVLPNQLLSKLLEPAFLKP